MDSHVIAADLECDQDQYSSDGDNPQKSCSDEKQQPLRRLIISPSVRVLCSTCSQPQWESEWSFSIEDGPVPINKKNTSSPSKRGDLMKEKVGKSQKIWKKMGRVIYHRPPRMVLSS